MKPLVRFELAADQQSEVEERPGGEEVHPTSVTAGGQELERQAARDRCAGSTAA